MAPDQTHQVLDVVLPAQPRVPRRRLHAAHRVDQALGGLTLQLHGALHGPGLARGRRPGRGLGRGLRLVAPLGSGSRRGLRHGLRVDIGLGTFHGPLFDAFPGALRHPNGEFFVKLDTVILEELFELRRLLVPEVEEAVPGVVGVKPELGAVRSHTALGPHGEGLGAARAELVLALRARAVHATALGEGKLRATLRASDAVFREVLGEPRGLRLGIILLFPLSELFTRYVLVLLLPCSTT